MSIIFDNRNRIATRIKQLQTGKRHSQRPPSRLCRSVTNVEVLGSEGADTVVTSVVQILESRDRGPTLVGGAGDPPSPAGRRRAAHGGEEGRARRLRPGPAVDVVPRMTSPEPVGVVASEFAAVSVSVDHAGNGPRLRLEDLRSGAVRYLDALELESIVWAPSEWVRELLDPSRHRWRDADPGPAPELLRDEPGPPAPSGP